jgi:chitinase
MYATDDSKNNGLHQPGKRIATSASFKNFPIQLSADSGWVHHWDDVAKAPFGYNPEKKIFVTYDDKRSVELKAKYVVDRKLGGMMFWQLGQDTFTDGLLNTIYKIKKDYNSEK